MGYTHYFTQTRDYTPDEWAGVCEDISTLLRFSINAQGIPIGNASGDRPSKPEIGPERIRFNGMGDDAHETFVVNRIRTLDEWQSPDRLGWDFCKTARKPYDTVVTAALCYLSTVCETHEVSSDGSGKDFVPGLELARQALPRYANMIDIPMQVMADDRWCAPFPSIYANEGIKRGGYDFSLCVDGYAYIIGPGGKSYRFYSHHEAAQWAESHTEKPITVTDWQGRKVREGGGRLFKPSGYFDEARHLSLGKQQRAAMNAMLAKAEGDRAIPPPAFIRPGDMPEVEARPYYFADLLKEAERA